jgi:hypothetical protein
VIPEAQELRSEQSLAAPDVGLLKRSFPTLTSLLLAFLVCIVAPFSLIGIHIHENPRFSPIDEAAQFDYVSRLAQASMPRLGQRMLPSTLHVLSCTGAAFPHDSGPKCPGTDNPSDYPGDAYQYEAQQPPTYYAIAVPFRWIGVHLFGMQPLTAIRSLGALWLSAGLILLWMAGRILGVSVGRLGVAALLLAGAPVVIYQSSIVSNDAPSVFAGSLIVFLAAMAWTRPGRWVAPTLGLAALFVTSFKADDILAVIVVSGVLARLWWASPQSGGRRTAGRVTSWFRSWGPNGGALLLGGVVSALAWVIINRRLNLIDPAHLPSFNELRKVPVGLALIAHESLLMLNPVAGSFSAFRTNAIGTPIGRDQSLNIQAITSTFLTYLFLAGGLAGLFVQRRRWNHWLGLLSLPVLYVGGIVLGIGLWRTYHIDPSISGRYGLSVVPLLALALVVNVRGRWVLAALWTFAVALVGLSYFYMLAA